MYIHLRTTCMSILPPAFPKSNFASNTLLRVLLTGTIPNDPALAFVFIRPLEQDPARQAFSRRGSRVPVSSSNPQWFAAISVASRFSRWAVVECMTGTPPSLGEPEVCTCQRANDTLVTRRHWQRKYDLDWNYYVSPSSATGMCDRC